MQTQTVFGRTLNRIWSAANFAQLHLEEDLHQGHEVYVSENFNEGSWVSLVVGPKFRVIVYTGDRYFGIVGYGGTLEEAEADALLNFDRKLQSITKTRNDLKV